MPDITKAQQARVNKTLDMKRRFDNGIFSWRELIDQGSFIKAEIEEVPRIQWNRRKFNRMNHREQEEYERKCDEMKLEYQLYTTETSHYSVPKIVYDYYMNTIKKEDED